jgi:hypothetical protein
MLPQNHFAVAAVVTLVTIVLFYPDLDLVTTIVWMLVSGVVAAVIDLDVIMIVRRRAKDDRELEPWANPMEVVKDFTGFLVLLERKGILSTVKMTHLLSGIIFTVAGFVVLPSLFIPITLGAWSHLATDVPLLRKIRMAAELE